MTDAGWLDLGENTAEWQALIEAIELADFFQLRAVQLAEAHLEPLFLAALAAEYGGRPARLEITRLTELLVDIPLDASARERLRRASGWCMVAGSAEPSAVARAAAILNQRRDVIRDLLDGPLVMALHPLDWQVVRLEATDLWSVHAGVHRFVAGPLPDPPGFPLIRPVCSTELPRLIGRPGRPMSAWEDRRHSPDRRQPVRRSEMESLIEVMAEAGFIDPTLRPLLLAGLPAGFVYSLPTVGRPIDQMRFDLMELRRTPALVGLDRSPLDVWLDNASDLFSNRPEAARFGAIRDHLAASSTLERRFSKPLVGEQDLVGFEADPTGALERLDALFARSTDEATRAHLAVDCAILAAHAALRPSRVRERLAEARSRTESLGDLRLITRLHARAAWIHGHFGDRRSGLAEVEEGWRVAARRGLDGGDDIVTELDTVAHWLALGA